MTTIYKTLVETGSMTREEWLKARKRGIGGSDVAKIFGESSYGNAMTVWKDKVSEGIIEETISPQAYFGHLLEDMVAAEFERQTGKKLRRRNAIIQSIQYPFMIACLDRYIVGEDSFLECVTTNSYQEKYWEDGAVPMAQMLQIQHYMAVMGYKYCYIATLIGNSKFVYTKVNRDEELIAEIIRREKQLWYNNVLTNIEPAPDGSAFSTEFIKTKYPVAVSKTTMNLDESYLALLQHREELAEQIKALETLKDEIDNKIKNEMKEYEIAICGPYKIAWRNCKKTNLDKSLIPAEYIEKASTVSNYRRFEVK